MTKSACRPLNTAPQGADPNARNAAGLQPLDLACTCPDKPPGAHGANAAAGRAPVVKPSCVPIHALLVSHGAVHSARFRWAAVLGRARRVFGMRGGCAA